MNKYKAIGFDHMGVIVGTSAAKFHQKISEVLKVRIEDFNKAYLSHNTDFNTGKTTKEEFWKLILKDLNKESSFESVMLATERPTEVNVDVINVIKELKSKGYKVGLLSNDTLEGGSLMREEEHLDELFDVMLISAETGLAKPNDDAFIDFMDKLGVSANELVYIDDANRNIVAANNLGIDTILCTDPSEVRNGLKEKGIL